MRCDWCEIGRTKCSLTSGMQMTLRKSMKYQQPARKDVNAMSWIYHPPHFVGDDTPSPEALSQSPPDDVQELSTPPSTVAAMR